MSAHMAQLERELEHKSRIISGLEAEAFALATLTHTLMHHMDMDMETLAHPILAAHTPRHLQPLRHPPNGRHALNASMIRRTTRQRHGRERPTQVPS